MRFTDPKNAIALSDAIIFTTEAHKGQVNKHNGEPYILHPLDVMRKFRDPDLMIVAVLHDVVEDTSVCLGDIYEEFDVEIGDAIDAITHRKGETNKQYWERCAENDLAYEVKLVDVFINSERTGNMEYGETRDRLEKKYRDAAKYLREYRDFYEWDLVFLEDRGL